MSIELTPNKNYSFVRSESNWLLTKEICFRGVTKGYKHFVPTALICLIAADAPTTTFTRPSCQLRRCRRRCSGDQAQAA